MGGNHVIGVGAASVGTDRTVVAVEGVPGASWSPPQPSGACDVVPVPAVVAERDWLLSGASLYLYSGGSVSPGVAMARKVGTRSISLGDSFLVSMLRGALLTLARCHFGAERLQHIDRPEESCRSSCSLQVVDSGGGGDDYSTASIVASVGHLAPMYDPMLGSMLLKEWRTLQGRLRTASPTRVLLTGLVKL